MASHPRAERTTTPGEFARYKADVKTRGKPFFPYAMFHDTIMSLVVVVHDHRAGGDLEVDGVRAGPRSAHKGLLGPEYDPPADPGTTSFVPRPDWYFYFLFYLLRIFKWPESVFLGTVGVPTIAAHPPDHAAVPRPPPRAEAVGAAGRHGRRRPRRSSRWASLTWKGATAKEALASEVIGTCRRWVARAICRKQPSRARICSREPAALRATRTRARAARTSARRT